VIAEQEAPRGLDRCDVALALVHACGFGGLVTLVAFYAQPFGFDLERDGEGASLFLGGVIGGFFLLLALVARRGPRKTIPMLERALCITSGLGAGLALPIIIRG